MSEVNKLFIHDFWFKSLWWLLLLKLGFTSFSCLFWGEKRRKGDREVFRSKSCHLSNGLDLSLTAYTQISEWQG